jgi:hypothetical protein
MKFPFAGVLGSLALWLVRKYRRLSLEWLRLEAALWYVRGVRTARAAFLSVLLLAVCVLLAAAGFVLVHIGLYALLPWPANARTLLILGAFYLLLAGWSLWWVCSEKTWMRYSNARQIMERALRRAERRPPGTGSGARGGT